MPFKRPPNLRADCASCRALCCVGPPFYAIQGFGFDKPVNTPCPNLRGDFRCAIHRHLRSHGFPSCAGFDCYGAGRRVTRLFGADHCRVPSQLAPWVLEVYSRYRALHELMAVIEAAIEYAPPPHAQYLAAIRDLIDELCESGATASRALCVETVQRAVRARLRAAIAWEAYAATDRHEVDWSST